MSQISQLQFPGQAAAPDGPVDFVNMYAFHFAFRRDLARFAEVVPRTAPDDAAAWRLLSERWDLFAGQLHHHHEAEDRVLWPWLRTRVSAGELAVLDLMQLEHEAIDPVLTRIAKAFAALAGGDPSARAGLGAALADASAVLGEHLAHEETESLAIMQRVMTDAQWKELEAQFRVGQPPTAVLTMVPWVLSGLPDADRAALLRRAPKALGLLARLLSPRFERRERRCFG